MQFPAPFRLVVDSANLLQILDCDAGTRFVFDKNVFPCLGVFLMIRTFRETHSPVVGVVTNSLLLPRHRATRVFFLYFIISRSQEHDIFLSESVYLYASQQG